MNGKVSSISVDSRVRPTTVRRRYLARASIGTQKIPTFCAYDYLLCMTIVDWQPESLPRNNVCRIDKAKERKTKIVFCSLVSQAWISESERFVALYSPFFIIDFHSFRSFGRSCPGIRDVHNIVEYRKLAGSMNFGVLERSNEQTSQSSIYIRKLQYVGRFMRRPAKYSLLELIIRGEIAGRRSRGTFSNVLGGRPR